MAEQQLREAYTLMKEGDKQGASKIVKAVLRQDSSNVNAWWMMANIIDDPDKQAKAAQKVLSLNPNHAGAKKMMSLRGVAQQSVAQPKSVPQRDPHAPVTEQEYDWSKIEARDATKKKRDEDAGDEHVLRLAGFVMGGIGILLVVAFIGMVIVPRLMGGNPQAAIENNLEQLFNHLFTGDIEATNNLICAEQRLSADELQELAEVFGLFNQMNAEIDLSGAQANIISREGNRATVQLTGSMTVSMAMDGMTNTTTMDIGEMIPADEAILIMVRENGRWLLCDTSLEF